MGSKARRGWSALFVVIVILGAGAIGIRMLWAVAQKAVTPNGCRFGDGTSLDLGQSVIASTMVSVVLTRGLPERASVLVVGAALQESKLRNIPSGAGDRDSVGVLQQRPSQGWGSATQLADVHYATGKFLDALVKIPNWQTGDFATIIQKVQVSAEGDAYTKHAQRAQAIADALSGDNPTAVTCTFDQPTVVAAPTKVAKQLSADLPVTTPYVDGDTITVSNAGWATAGWFVAHADQYGIAKVRYSGKEWARSKGWHDKADAPADGVTAEMATVKK